MSALIVSWSLGLTLLSGCIVDDAAEAVKEGIVAAPTSEVTAVEVIEQTEQGVAVETTVALSNPNPVALPLDAVDVVVEVDGVGRFASPTPPTVVLPPEGSQSMTVRAALPLGQGAGGGASLAGRGYTVRVTSHWVPPGEVRAILTDSGIPLPFTVAEASGVLGE